MIRVERKNRSEFLVVVEERGSRTEHTVTLDEEYYGELTRRKCMHASSNRLSIGARVTQ